MNFLVGYLVIDENAPYPGFIVTAQFATLELAVVARDYLAGIQPDKQWYLVQYVGVGA